MRAHRPRSGPSRLRFALLAKAVHVAVFAAAAVLAAAILGAPVGQAAPEAHGEPAGPEAVLASARRVVSLNPSLSAIAVALGARQRLVGVDDWSAEQVPELASLPRVGGLYNPSLEAVVALEPDLVMLVPSAEQRDFRARVEDLGIQVEVFENITFREVLENIERIGHLLGREGEARARVDAIRATRARVAAAVASLQSPRTLLVLQRDPLFVAGSDNFIDEMVTAAGGDNLGRAFGDAYPRTSLEWAIEAAPEVILDLGPDPDAARSFWQRWDSLPAVREGRVIPLDAAVVSLPGPYLDRSLEALARALHGDRLDLAAHSRTKPAPPDASP